MAIYDRDKATFFTTSGGVVAPDRLTNEVVEQFLSPSLTSITDSPADALDVCRFDFDGTLSGEQESILDSICANHSGVPLPEPPDDPISHAALTGVMPDQHHAELHAASHCVGQGDEVSLDPSQVGADQAAFNANRLQGRVIGSAAPASAQVLTWSGLEWAPADVQGSGFPEMYYEESEGISSTSSTTPVSKVAIKEDLLGGLYMVEWYAEVWSPAYYEHQRVVVTLDDAQYIAYTDTVMMGRYNENPISGHKVVRLEAGTHKIDLMFARVESYPVYIRRGRLFLQKVGE